MNTVAIAAIGGLFLPGCGILFQFIKLLQERREKKKKDRRDTELAGEERDSMAVRTAELSLVMMRGMLDVAKSTEVELRQRIKELEQDNTLKELRIRELETKLFLLERRMTEQERRE